MGITKQQFNTYSSRINIAMKFLALTAFLVGCSFAEEGPYPPSGSRPQGALLLLPNQRSLARPSQTAAQYSAPQYLSPQPETDEADNLKKASENFSSRLRQNQGAGSGNYYVYQDDGRLQRAQYTSAQLRAASAQASNQQVNLQNTQTFVNSNTLQFNQQNAHASAKLQEPAQNPSQSQLHGEYAQPQKNNLPYDHYDQIYNTQFNKQKTSGQLKEQPITIQKSVELPNNQFNEGAASNQYKEQVPASNLRPLPSKPEKLTQPQESQNNENQSDVLSNPYSSVAVQGAGGQETVAFPQQQLYQYQLQQQQYYQPLSSAYVASVQYSHVQPIATPIYAYTSAPLVRILRDASYHH